MINVAASRIILLISFFLLFCCNIYTQQNGDTRIAKWKDDKVAAFSLNFDDSIPSELDIAVPHLEARDLPGTFYVNPGKSSHQNRNAEWLDIVNRGQHLGSHTMNHKGASSYEEALYEIGASAEYVWDTYGIPYHSELIPYASGGGVTWTGLTREERLAIDDSFNLINRYHNNPTESHWHSARMPYSMGVQQGINNLLEHFDDNTADGDWEMVLWHGVGDSWSSSQPLNEFITFVDYLESKKSTVWIAPYIAVFKYDMERFSAEVEVLENTSDIIKLRLSSDISASGYITNHANLYNEPLTLITQVPWLHVIVTQGSSSKTYEANNGEVMYEALPNVGTTNRGDIILQETEGLPVELTSFTASVKNSSVILAWETATEINNYGFEVHRQVYPTVVGTQDNQWHNIGFVDGNGNSNSTRYYSFTDDQVLQGNYRYKLKQIDNDGTYEYSKEIEVFVGIIPNNIDLEQNYPNPFNPITNISFEIPIESFVSLKVLDALGNEITTLVYEKKPAGNYKVEFSANSGGSELSSGIYFYRLQAGAFAKTKKMILMR